MRSLFKNYLREQKYHLVQVLGLLFLIVIMVSSFLSIKFSSDYLENHYLHQIAEHKLNQQITFNSNPKFILPRHKYLLFANMLPYKDQISAQNNNFDQEKFKKNSWKLEKLAKNDYYRFHFFSDDPKQHNVAVGENLWIKTGKKYLDFNIVLPKNLQDKLKKDELAKRRKILKNYANNKINFFILNKDMLEYFTNKLNYNPDSVAYQQQILMIKLYFIKYWSWGLCIMMKI